MLRNHYRDQKKTIACLMYAREVERGGLSIEDIYSPQEILSDT